MFYIVDRVGTGMPILRLSDDADIKFSDSNNIEKIHINIE